MKLRIRNQKDFAAGLIYVVSGAAFSLGALNYKLGEAARMGPGWFPFWVGVLLAAVGMATTAMALRPRGDKESLTGLDLRTMAWVLGAVVAFGVLLEPLGLVVSLAVLVVISSMASHEFTWRGAIANAVVLVLISVGAFIWGIHLQIPMWPSFLSA